MYILWFLIKLCLWILITEYDLQYPELKTNLPFQTHEVLYKIGLLCTSHSLSLLPKFGNLSCVRYLLFRILRLWVGRILCFRSIVQKKVYLWTYVYHNFTLLIMNIFQERMIFLGMLVTDISTSMCSLKLCLWSEILCIHYMTLIYNKEKISILHRN